MKFLIAMLLLALIASTLSADKGYNGRNGDDDDDDDGDDDDDDDNGNGNRGNGYNVNGYGDRRWPDSSNLRSVGSKDWGKSEGRSTGPAYYNGLRNGGRGNSNRGYYGG